MRLVNRLLLVALASRRLRRTERRIDRWASRSNAGALAPQLRAEHVAHAAALLDAWDALAASSRRIGPAVASRRRVARDRLSLRISVYDQLERGLRAFGAAHLDAVAPPTPAGRAEVGNRLRREASCAAQNASVLFDLRARSLHAMAEAGDVGTDGWNEARGEFDQGFARLLDHTTSRRALDPGADADARLAAIVATYRAWTDALDGAENCDPAL
jgi:hypothetical protein